MSQFCNWALTTSGYDQCTAVVDTLPPGAYNFDANGDGSISAYTMPLAGEHGILIDGVMADVLREVGSFWDARDAYAGLGISYKRGLLLHGPTGAGKSATVREVSRRAIARGGVVSVTSGLYDLKQCLPLFAMHESERLLVVVLEDVERHCDGGSIESILLEVTDGELRVPEGTLFIATTNNLEKMPVRLRDRRSRFDRLFYFGPPDRSQRRQYLGRFALNGDNDAILEATDGLSLADIKEVVIRTRVFGEPMDVVLARLKETALTS